MVSDLGNIQGCITNKLNEEVESVSYFVGIVGDRPSQYAKSPTIWNPTLKKFEFDTFYVAFDVEEDHLSDLLKALKAHPQLLGFNVTVPYKVKILPLLDELDSKAKRIGAVNTVVRDHEGRLVGLHQDFSVDYDCVHTPAVGVIHQVVDRVEYGSPLGTFGVE